MDYSEARNLLNNKGSPLQARYQEDRSQSVQQGKIKQNFTSLDSYQDDTSRSALPSKLKKNLNLVANETSGVEAENRQLEMDLQYLNSQIEMLEQKIANKFQRKEVRKPCDHAATLNQLETMLKSKENEYLNLTKEFQSQIQELDKQLNQTNAQIKQIQKQQESHKFAIVNGSKNVVNSALVNQLRAKLKEEEQRTNDLSVEIQSQQKIVHEQSLAVQKIEGQNQYSSQIDKLLADLKTQKDQNKHLEDQIRTAQQQSRGGYLTEVKKASLRKRGMVSLVNINQALKQDQQDDSDQN